MEIKRIMARVFEIMDSNGEVLHEGCITTGYKELDKLMGAIHSDDLIIVTGNNSLGNAFSWNMIVSRINNGECSNSILVISPDTSKEQYAMQLLSVKSGVPYNGICDASRSLKQRDWDKITLDWEPICESKLHIYDQESITVDEIHELAIKISLHSGLDMIVIDSITSLSGRSNKQFVDETNISRSQQLKAMAESLNTPVLAVSDYKSILDARDRSGRRKNNLPVRVKRMAGADLVILLLDDDSPEQARLVKIQILENNRGQCGSIKLEYTDECFRLEEVGSIKDQDKVQ